LAHDVVHGVWHIDKGIFFTIKELMVRPGYAARDYISGKRRSYFNLITLAALIIAVILFISGRIVHDTEFVVVKNSGERIEGLFFNNLKLILLSFIPLFAISSQLFFRKLRLNYSEHAVGATFFFVGFLVLILFQTLLEWILKNDYFRQLYLSPTIEIVYLVFGYVQFTRGNYSLPGFAWRMFGVLFIFLLVTLVAFLILYVVLDLQHFGWENIPAKK
jgi:hypothetical protein